MIECDQIVFREDRLANRLFARTDRIDLLRTKPIGGLFEKFGNLEIVLYDQDLHVELRPSLMQNGA